MIKVYGCSDDLVEVEGAEYPYDEIGCFEHDVILEFTDGTIIRVGYPKMDMAVWWIKVIADGSGSWGLEHCDDEDAEIYSDVFVINGEEEIKLKRVRVVKKEEA